MCDKRSITMKKFIILIICVTTAAAFISTVMGQGLGERIKRSACQKVCERSYNDCMKDSEKKEDGYASDVKDAAKEDMRGCKRKMH